MEFAKQFNLKKISLSNVHHLIRYFLILGFVAFVAYLKQWFDPVFAFIIGPSLHLAYYLKTALATLLPIGTNTSPALNQFGFLFPVTLLYFGLMGMFFKQLWNEKGGMKLITFTALLAFVIYIHFVSGAHLLSYLGTF